MLLHTSRSSGPFLALFGPLRMFFFHDANEILERGLCDDAVRLLTKLLSWITRTPAGEIPEQIMSQEKLATQIH